MLKHILIIEDDPDLASVLTMGLQDAGYKVTHAADGELGLDMAQKDSFDALIVDRMLPKCDGLSVITELRSKGDQTPVLILSALDQVDDRVTGLRAGGDDYLPKPYALAELLARLEALLRRNETTSPQTKLRVGDLEMDLIARTVTRAGKDIDLQPREFTLLEYLIRHAGQTVTRTMLLEGVWDFHFDPQTNVIDVHISRLRQKIDKGFSHAMLQTVRGSGYMIKAS
ncbi:MAG TPA: response regulator transcription factor [Alphaproteobacteria bacterium]|nr:DNA-binding response regulator [Rhodospirillaceae bacterium]HRJ12053.1 response regulator transcription factor [Alphaproteobacteria bacterium]